jgi:hypothetical protein
MNILILTRYKKPGFATVITVNNPGLNWGWGLEEDGGRG